MAKKYVSLSKLSTFLDNLKILFATKSSVDELSEDVAYINTIDNETITDTEISSTSVVIDSYLSETSTNPVQNKIITKQINELLQAIEDSADIDVTAAVGQTIVVKSVDENGKPTEWEAVDFQSDWNADEDEAGHILNRTHYKDLQTGDLFPTQEINIDELGAGTHLIFESSSNAHFTNTFAYDKVKHRRANTKGASAVGFELGGIIYTDKGVEKTMTVSNIDYYTEQLELIDSKNYKFKYIGFYTNSQIFVVVDVTTLTAEYQALFPKVGVYIQIPENDSSYGMTNRRYIFQVYFYKHMSTVYMSPEIARTAYVIPTPSSAEVGQVITVKAIDENGKVTETVGYNLTTDEDSMDLLSELGAVTPVTTSSGEVLTNNAGEIYTL